MVSSGSQDAEVLTWHILLVPSSCLTEKQCLFVIRQIADCHSLSMFGLFHFAW